MMIKADVFLANKNWEKYIKFPAIYINKKLKTSAPNFPLKPEKAFKISLKIEGSTS